MTGQIEKPDTGPRHIHVTAFHDQTRGQGVSAREHVAFKCVMCGTVQSMWMMRIRAGVDMEDTETVIGFSCIGRWLDAGPWPNDAAAQANREAPGCDWSLGGLFRIHTLEVITSDGPRPCFELATPAEAQALEADLRPAIDALATSQPYPTGPDARPAGIDTERHNSEH